LRTTRRSGPGGRCSKLIIYLLTPSRRSNETQHAAGFTRPGGDRLHLDDV